MFHRSKTILRSMRFPTEKLDASYRHLFPTIQLFLSLALFLLFLLLTFFLLLFISFFFALLPLSLTFKRETMRVPVIIIYGRTKASHDRPHTCTLHIPHGEYIYFYILMYINILVHSCKCAFVVRQRAPFPPLIELVSPFDHVKSRITVIPSNTRYSK